MFVNDEGDQADGKPTGLLIRLKKDGTTLSSV
jgi:hypothetical protein